MLRLVCGNLNYSSWSVRPWLAVKYAGLEFRTHDVGLRTEEGWKDRILSFLPSRNHKKGNGRCGRTRWLPRALLLAGMLSALGCRGRNLIGSHGGDGGTDTSGDASIADASTGTDAVPSAVDPVVSRAWTWQRCGTIASEAADRAALFDPNGGVAVLGEHGVRQYDASGVLRSTSNELATFLIAAPDGAPLAGRYTSSAIEMTPLGASTPRFTFPVPSGPTCGRILTFSTRGDYLLAYEDGATCVWRTSDQTLVANVANVANVAPVGVAPADQVALRGDKLVRLYDGPQTTDVVTLDFTGSETARVKLPAEGPSFLSPSGDRVVTPKAVWDLDGATAIPYTSEDGGAWPPVFSAAGDLVLIGGSVFRTSDGVRQHTLKAGSRATEMYAGGTVLSTDGRRIVSMGRGRATLFDIGSDGIAAVLGQPLRQGSRGRPISHLALSVDGSLLVSNVGWLAAFGIKLAPSFDESRVIWDVSTSINLVVDISPDNQLVAIGGDGRALFSAVDGRRVWNSPPPPADLPVDSCLPERLRFSPKRTWVAGNTYQRTLDVFAVGDATPAMPWTSVVHLSAGCDAVVFSRDERFMATSGGAFYQTAPTADGWRKLWSVSVPAASRYGVYDGMGSDISFSPDETQLLISSCNGNERCATRLVSVQAATVLRDLPALDAPHPSFSPDGSWIVAGGSLLHLASGDVRPLDPAVKTTVALFTPEGDIIAGSDDVLTRYCRNH